MGIKENLEELARRSSEAEVGGGEERIGKQHEAGKLTARERVELLLDPNSFVEMDRFVPPLRRLRDGESSSGTA